MPISRLPRGATSLNPGDDPALILLAQNTRLKSITEGRVQFFSKLIAGAEHAGVPVFLYTLTAQARTLMQKPGNLYILCEDGMGYGPGILHAAPHFMDGYWHLDELGTGAHSSIRLRQFDKRSVRSGKASQFFKKLQSNFPLDIPPANLPTGAMLMICAPQDMADSPHMNNITLAKAVIHMSGDHPVILHMPDKMPKGDKAALVALSEVHPDIHLTQTSLPRLLPLADVVITAHTPFGLQALIAERPLVMAGQSDLFPGVVNALGPDDVGVALLKAAERDWYFADFVYWYLEQQLLQPKAKDFVARVRAIARRKGFILGPIVTRD